MLHVTTIRKRADFLSLNRGFKSVTPFFALRSGPSPEPRDDTCRVGFTVTVKCGNAVLRNRTRRRLRALVRELFPTHARAGTDYVFIAYARAEPTIATADYALLRTAMRRALSHSRRAAP